MFRALRMSCEDTSQLISEMMDHRVSFAKKLRIRFHLAICKICGYHKDQLHTVQNLARNLGKEECQALRDVTMPLQTKEKIKKVIESYK